MPLDEPTLDIGDIGDLADIIDIILDYLDIRVDIIRPDIGDYPPVTYENLEEIVAIPEVREQFAQRVSEAQAQGRALPLPTAREFAVARERLLARRQQRRS